MRHLDAQGGQESSAPANAGAPTTTTTNKRKKHMGANNCAATANNEHDNMASSHISPESNIYAPYCVDVGRKGARGKRADMLNL